MEKGLLTKSEIDALMDLFETQQPRQRAADAEPAAPGVEVGALKTRLETMAVQWSAALATLTGRPSKVSLRTILRVSVIAAEASDAYYRCEMPRECYLICPESFVNFVNEKGLGALEEIPMTVHPLSAIDRALFESTGSFMAEGGRLWHVEKLPSWKPVIEARFDVEIVPLLRTTLRLVTDGQSV